MEIVIKLDATEALEKELGSQSHYLQLMGKNHYKTENRYIRKVVISKC